MKAHMHYLRYVLRHKLFVYQAGRQLSLGRWQLLTHDLSKFRADEWVPYARYFYGPTVECCHLCEEPKRAAVGKNRPACGNPVCLACGEPNAPRTFRPPPAVRAAFDRAWLAHLHRNPHHFQHYILHQDDGSMKVLPMPDRYRREMLADWRGTGLALGKSDTREWYKRKWGNIVLHPDTRAWVEHELGLI